MGGPYPILFLDGKMSSMKVRFPEASEMETVFMMGFDAWSEGSTHEAFLEKCYQSPKYKKGQWYVLVDTDNRLLSKLIAYELGSGKWALGSIATPPVLRKKGYASRLIEDILKKLEETGPQTFFLFCEISTRFYEDFGFRILPEQFQKRPGSILMSRCPDFEKMISDSSFEPPGYC